MVVKGDVDGCQASDGSSRSSGVWKSSLLSALKDEGRAELKRQNSTSEVREYLA
jgi:hypothetical protein